MSAMKYLQKIARVLPTCKGADGVPFRHLQNLKTLYKRGGIDAIDFYSADGGDKEGSWGREVST